MWELIRKVPFGRLSKRSNAIFATMVMVASFALSLLIAPTAFAADATWQGNAISYAGKQFVKTTPAGLPAPANASTDVYIYFEPDTSGASNPTQKAHIIYFAPGADPPTATSVNYITFTHASGVYTNGSAPALITLGPQGSSSTSTGVTSCAVEGIGWIICPITNFLAGAMDWMFGILSNFLTVRPVQTTTDNALFRMWNVMRNFANVIFVIAFLIVIYSQVTSVGLSNYGIKKILPRLIVVAILVNVSYWLCAVAVDLSNISGNAVQQLFINLRNTMVGSEGNGWDLGSWQEINWESITGFILSGGTAVTVGAIAAHSLIGATVTGALYMLLPTLVLVLTSVLVALLIMALRQALITVLIIASPFIFVAYLLPNTEKFGEKGINLFTTMLIMFPILSVIFGGSQLAGTAIIQNADSINLVILGMGVQVAPLIVTPLLIRFSGALLTRVAGMVNNPNKGLIDRTRNWAKDRADWQKSKVLSKQPRPGVRGFMTRRSHAIEAKRREREGQKKAFEAGGDALWANDARSHRIHEAIERANMQKDRGEAIAEAHVNRLKTTPGHAMQIDDVNLRVAKLEADVTKAQGDVQFENLRAEFAPGRNPVPTNNELGRAAMLAQQLTQESMVASRQIHSAQHEQQQDFANALKASTSLQQAAGGISEHGADAALAAAITTSRKAYGQSVSEAREVIKHFNLSSEQRQDLALGNTLTDIKDSSGNSRTFTAQDIFAREAAIEDQIKTGTIAQVQQLVELSGKGAPLQEFRTTISSSVAEAGIGSKAFYLGGATINEIAKGNITSPEKMMGVIQDNIAKGKVSAEKLIQDKDATEAILKAASQLDRSLMTEDQSKMPSAIADLKATATLALTDKNLKGKIPSNIRPLLEQLEKL